MRNIVIWGLVLCLCAGLPCTTRANAAGTLPTAENLEVSTLQDTALAGRLTASDPQGDPLIFFVATEPVKGTLVLREDGSFVYTPGPGKKGRDYFGYRVTDPEGNRSQEATVIIRIQKLDTKSSY